MTEDSIPEEKKVVNKIDLHAELIETGVEQVLIDLDKSLIGLDPVKTRIRCYRVLDISSFYLSST